MNPKIYECIKANKEWIYYSNQYSSYYIKQNDLYVSLIKEVFKDIAHVNTWYLNIKPKERVYNLHIGCNMANHSPLSSANKEKDNIYIMPVNYDGRNYIKLKFRYSRNIYKLLQHYESAFKIESEKAWVILPEKLYGFLKFIIPQVRISVNRELQINDISIVKLL